MVAWLFGIREELLRVGGVRTRLFGPPPSCMKCVAIVSFSFARLRGMDSSIDESDLGSLSRRRTSLEVEREGNRKRSPFLPLFVFFSPLFPFLNITEIGFSPNLVREGSFNGALFVWSSKGGLRNKPPPDETAVYKRATRDIERRAPMRVFGATRMP